MHEAVLDHHPFSIGWLGDLEGTRKITTVTDSCASVASSTPPSLAPSPPIEPVKLPPAHDSDEHILNALNDDCFRDIFESSALDLMDLIAIGNVCKRFHSIARQVFKRKYRDLAQHFPLTTESLWQTEMFVRTFGNEIASIDLTRANEPRTDIHLRLILAHCTRITALKCEMHEDQTITAVRSILPQLRHFEVYTRESMDLSRLFDVNQAYQLQTLKTVNALLPIMRFPQLTELHVEANESRRQRFIERFFRINGQLLQLTIRNYDFDDNIGSLVQLLPHLQYFVVENSKFCRDFLNDSYSFGRLKQLKLLRLCAQNHNQSTLLAILQALVSNNIQLEQLTLTGLHGNAVLLIDMIQQLKSIKLLKIDWGDEESLIRLASGLTQLRDLSISCNFLTIDAIRDTLRLAQCLTRAKFRVRQPIVEEAWMKFNVRDEINEMHQQRKINLKISLRRHESPVFGVRASFDS